MAAVLYLLGLISIALGAVVGVDRFVDAYSLNLSLSVAYQAIVGGILLFVMARLLQHAAATARNTEKFYQQAPINTGAGAAAAPTVETPAPTVAAPKATAEPPKVETPKAEEKPAEPDKAAEPAPEKPAEAPAPAAEPTVVEQIEYRGYMIDKLSNGKVDVHTTEGPMQFESLETFARELELSNG